MYKIYISFINPHHIQVYGVNYILFILQNFNLKSVFSTLNGFCSILPATEVVWFFFPPEGPCRDFGIIPGGTGRMQAKLVTKPPASRGPRQRDPASRCPPASHLSPPASLQQNQEREERNPSDGSPFSRAAPRFPAPTPKSSLQYPQLHP